MRYERRSNLITVCKLKDCFAPVRSARNDIIQTKRVKNQSLTSITQNYKIKTKEDYIMKMIFLSYKQSVNDEIMEIFENLNISSYTKWPEVQDKCDTGRPRMGSHIWPGLNSAIILAVDDEKSTEFMARIKKLNETIEHEKIKAFIMPIEESTEC